MELTPLGKSRDRKNPLVLRDDDELESFPLINEPGERSGTKMSEPYNYEPIISGGSPGAPIKPFGKCGHPDNTNEANDHRSVLVTQSSTNHGNATLQSSSTNHTREDSFYVPTATEDADAEEEKLMPAYDTVALAIFLIAATSDIRFYITGALPLHVSSGNVALPPNPNTNNIC
ncbi:hypothetical protein L2E82_14701 [Cichorium intybus]|uniref:Uncharacterized protein n=1 Tax=Cichorium intybus TaxID=13427 RepID=A0ACB9F1D1_CICIN|nr:hypothetical protein L2E82_14701 [Cichorium intybus]